MHPKAQREVFENLLVTHGLNVDAAYADFVEEVGDDTAVSASTAEMWARHFTREEAREKSAELAAQAIGGKPLATRVTDFSALEKDKKLEAFDEAALTMFYTGAADVNHDVFEPKVRVQLVTKAAELLGTPVRVQARRGSGPQAAHQAVPTLSHTFGTLPDRQVMVMFLQDGQDVVRLTNTLRASNPDLAYLTPESVQGRLSTWQAQGVVMDAAQGIMMEWDDAVEMLQHQLRTLPSAD